MEGQNVVLITVEELRADHLSCCGYDRIETTHMDSIAREGAYFENCISASSFTGVCLASMLTGLIPPLHGRRHPYAVFRAKSVASIFQDRGYHTAAFVGVGAAARQFGFGQGFDHYDEPNEEVAYSRGLLLQDLYLGNWWIDRMLEWLRSHHESNFFVWGHIYETHEGSQWPLLERGILKEGELEDFGYYDAKLKLVDEEVFGPLLSVLKELGVYDDTIIAFTGDHGTNLGEHPGEPVPHRPGDLIYPQHFTLYDCDIKVPLAVKGKGVPSNHRVQAMVRSIDIAPTLLDLVCIDTVHQFSGISLLPTIETRESTGLVAYAEELFPKRGPGDFQALRTDRYKYIIDRRHGDAEEFYDLANDPDEQVNIVDVLDEDEQLLRKEMREVADFHYGRETEEKRWSEEEREKIDRRLRALGYVR